MASFTDRVKSLIKQIPLGRVATYGQVAALAGNPRGARQVSWILHSSSKKASLPWHRVVNRKGEISLPLGSGYERQKAALLQEGVCFTEKGQIPLDKYLAFQARDNPPNLS